MKVSEIRNKVITGSFTIGEDGMKEPVSALGMSDWEFYAKRLEEMLAKGMFESPQPAVVSDGESNAKYNYYVRTFHTPFTRKIAWDKAIDWLQSLNQKGEGAQERYDKARVYYNTEMGLTGLNASKPELTVINKALHIAAGLPPKPEGGKENEK